MPILPETEIIHPELGSICFDDGKSDPTIAGSKDEKPMWVCRKSEWYPDFEIYLPGGRKSPLNLDRGIAALRHRAQIEAEGKSLVKGNVELNWIDLTATPSLVAFYDKDHIYDLWKGQLTPDWRVKELTRSSC